MITDQEYAERDLHAVMQLQTRSMSDEEMCRFAGYMTEIFTALGMDVTSPGTEDTPRRFLRGLWEATGGYDGDPKLIKVFETECRGGADCRLSQVIEGPIPFFALCEHHALPFYGRAYVGYVAHEHIIGISKLTRLVRLFSRRFSLQGRIGQQVADTLVALLQPHGVAVYLEAQHLCMQMRGVSETAAVTRTTCWRGEYEDSPALRSDFLTACGIQR